MFELFLKRFLVEYQTLPLLLYQKKLFCTVYNDFFFFFLFSFSFFTITCTYCSTQFWRRLQASISHSLVVLVNHFLCFCVFSEIVLDRVLSRILLLLLFFVTSIIKSSEKLWALQANIFTILEEIFGKVFQNFVHKSFQSD